MKINEKFCCSVDFPQKTSIKVDSEVNLAWILQMPFFFIVFLFAKSFLKYHLAFLISLFYFYKGAIKLKLPNSPKTRRRSVSFRCSFFGIAIFPIRPALVTFLIFIRDVRDLINTVVDVYICLIFL